jgi:hypothetical protein
MAMEEWDDRALREINSLDAARLAIRGALATIRDLQDQNGLLKGQVQDDGAKRKALENRLTEMDSRLAQWQEQAAKWEKETAQREQMMERWKTEARMEVRAEERARVDADRLRTEETLARLRADLVAMSKAHKGKEDAWVELRRMLDARDADIMSLKREKQDILAKVKLDAQQLEMLREARDREMSAANRSRELEIADNDREIAALKRELEENKMALAAVAQDRELGVKAREEELVKAFQLKESDLVRRYQAREAELQARWSELETGLWAKTKESREKLDAAVQKQFEERARQIADRAKEVEDLLARRSRELTEDHEKRCAESEAHYAADERRLLASWAEKEQRLLAKVDAELEQQRGALQAAWADRHKILDAEHAERLRQVAAKIEELEAGGRRDRSRMLEESARRDAERVRAQDDFVARKAAELDKVHQELLVELAERGRALEEDAKRREEARQNEYLSRVAALESQHELRRGELLEEHRKTVEAEKFSLSAQFDQRQRGLDESYRAKVAECERAARALADQHESWKGSLREEFLRKEKDLDARWALREGEFVGRYETALEDQRRAFANDAVEARGRLEAQRRQIEGEALSREQNQRSAADRRDAELLARHSREQSERQAAHEARLSELRLAHDENLRMTREKAFEDLARERAGLQKDLGSLQERLAQAHAESDRARITDASLAKDLQSRINALEADRRALSESLGAVEKETHSLRAAIAERDRMREVDRARLAEEAKLSATAELARHLEEAERDRARALEERRVELEKAHASRRRSLEAALDERGRALDVKEQSLEEQVLRFEEAKASANAPKKPS